MWVPSIQGFTDPQGLQEETTGTCKVSKDREEGLESQEFPTPTCPQFLFTQTTTAAPKKQHELILLGERNF